MGSIIFGLVCEPYNSWKFINPNKSNPSGYTSTPNTEDGCADPGCFEDKISYEANKEQIEVN